MGDAGLDEGVRMDVSKLWEQIKAAAGPALGAYLNYFILIAVALVGLYVAWRILGRRKRKPPRPATDVAIDVELLGASGPPPGATLLEHYNLPVRLAAIVLAPVGHVRELPPDEKLDPLFEAIVPGLPEIVTAHRTVIRRWPAQLSPRGFAHAFFASARLPGHAGKGTPWCSAAGVFKFEGQPLMAGLVMRAEKPNGLSQVVVEHDTKWLDILRTRRPER